MVKKITSFSSIIRQQIAELSRLPPSLLLLLGLCIFPLFEAAESALFIFLLILFPLFEMIMDAFFSVIIRFLENVTAVVFKLLCSFDDFSLFFLYWFGKNFFVFDDIFTFFLFFVRGYHDFFSYISWYYGFGILYVMLVYWGFSFPVSKLFYSSLFFISGFLLVPSFLKYLFVFCYGFGFSYQVLEKYSSFFRNGGVGRFVYNFLFFVLFCGYPAHLLAWSFYFFISYIQTYCFVNRVSQILLGILFFFFFNNLSGFGVLLFFLILCFWNWYTFRLQHVNYCIVGFLIFLEFNYWTFSNGLNGFFFDSLLTCQQIVSWSSLELRELGNVVIDSFYWSTYRILILGSWFGFKKFGIHLFWIDEYFYLFLLCFIAFSSWYFRRDKSGLTSSELQFFRLKNFYLFSQIVKRSLQILILFTSIYFFCSYFLLYCYYYDSTLYGLLTTNLPFLENFLFSRSPFYLGILILGTWGGVLFFRVFQTIILSYPQLYGWSAILEPLIIFFLLIGALRWFIQTQNFISFFLTMELVSYCSLILMSCKFLSNYRSIYPTEAAFRFFLFSSIAIGLFFFAGFGFSLFSQTVFFKDIFVLVQSNPVFNYFYFNNFVFVYLIFFLAYLIKLGSVPVHQWLIDSYEGTELPITGFFISIIGPLFQFKLLSLLVLWELNSEFISIFFLTVGFLCQLIGTIGAFFQQRVKRFFLFLGLTHLSFIFVSWACGLLWGYYTAFFYIFIYMFLNVFLFLFLLFVKLVDFRHGGLVYFTNLKSIIVKNNFLILFFALLIFSFSGLPPFAIFFSKLVVFAALIYQNLSGLVLIFIFYIIGNVFLYLQFFKIIVFENNWYWNYFQIGTWWYKITYNRLQNLPRLEWLINNKFFPTNTFFVFGGILLFFIFFVPASFSLTFQIFLTIFLF